MDEPFPSALSLIDIQKHSVGKSRPSFRFCTEEAYGWCKGKRSIGTACPGFDALFDLER